MNKNVDHPSHYTFGKYEVIDVIEDWKLGYYESNIIKYIARAKHKGKELEDLRKAQWYLDRLVDRMTPTAEVATNGNISNLHSSMWDGLLVGFAEPKRAGEALSDGSFNKPSSGCCGISHGYSDCER